MLFQDIAVQLIAADVGQFANVGLAEILEISILPLRFPVESKVVFEVVLPKQMFLEVEDLGEIIAADLHQGFTDLLLLAGNHKLVVEQQDSF